METSLQAVHTAILENLEAAGDVGLHVDDLVRILGFDDKRQLLPRLYYLQGQNKIKRCDVHKWKIINVDSPPVEDHVMCDVEMKEAWCKDNFISYKNILQEYCQKKYLPVPSYKAKKANIGYIGNVLFGPESLESSVTMPSIKEAEQRAAFEALKSVGVLPNDAEFNIPSNVELPTKKRKATAFNGNDLSKKFVEVDESSSMKNKLQEIAQKHKLKMPEYQVNGINGDFVASVAFQGRVFSSTGSFQKKKLAEHDAAHVALYELGHIAKPPKGFDIRTNYFNGKKKTDTGIQKPNENFKNKLQEYAQRKKGALPEYTTTPQKFGDTNGFVCKVVVDGKEYISSFYLNKKDAEKNAAFAALMSLGLVSP